ncbi:MAG: M20 family peptidase [Dehalococcoidia bacterium]|nr:M20 family peptidase [Dehalococcoidia bacterium]
MNDKQRTQQIVQGAGEQLLALSRRIHSHPELGFEEERAAAWVSEALDRGGFAVESGVCGLPTAFRARAGNGPLNIAICAEYDALPGIGHACGHNVIAAAAVGAGIALAQVADSLGITVTVLGTPAEEVGDAGGKVLLLERGGFAGVHAAMMVHPMPIDELEPNVIASTMFDVRYAGKAAHAAAFPFEGINAADALTVAQVAIGLLRQHMRSSERVHGIITKGGDAPNIVPEATAARYLVRAPKLGDLQPLLSRVLRCFEAGALATGSTLTVSGGEKPYAEVVHDTTLSGMFRRNAEALGRRFPASGDPGTGMPFSTDMGNVSLAIPSIHPSLGIDSFPAVNHQAAFAAHCISPAAGRAIIDGAVAMAWTAIDAATEPQTRTRLLTPSR